jgi:isopenicillin-N N-acyltransferase-like protein
MRFLELPAGKSPREWGRIHGESFRGEIKSLADIRMYLCTKVGTFQNREQVMACAAAHLPVLERYDAALFSELAGIAEGANVTPEEIVVANHYTDLRDLDPDPATWRAAPTKDDPGNAASSRGGVVGDGCSTLFAKTPTGRILAQTWDMHATAIPYVMAMKLPDTPDALGGTLLSVTGCLGMAGMNRHGVGIAINNLFSIDATLGVVWPAMVRRALQETTAKDACNVIMGSPIGSGHHYFVADPHDAFGIEASGTRRKIVWQRDVSAAEARYCHTNHCIDADIEARSKVPPTSTTRDRMAWLERDMTREPIRDLDDTWQRLGSTEGYPRSICTNMATPEAPHGVATCAAIAMNLDTKRLYIQQGFIHNVAPEKYEP